MDDNRLDDMGNRLVRIESKLDEHLQRVTAVETDMRWLKGHVRIVTPVARGITGTLGALLLQYLFPNIP